MKGLKTFTLLKVSRMKTLGELVTTSHSYGRTEKFNSSPKQ